MTCQPRLRARPEGRFRPTILASGILLLASAACEVPTEAPEVDTRWVVPVEETTVSVGELLPDGEVTLNADSSAFLVDADQEQVQQVLGDLCGLCTPALDGQTIPKPPFSDTVRATLGFPASIAAFTVQSGSVEILLENGLNFDPIRPGATATGSLTVEIRDSSDDDLLGSVVVDGVTSSLPPGGSLSETIVLMPTSVEGELIVDVAVNSPLGDPVVLDRSLAFSATGTAVGIEVSDVTVDVSNQSVELDPVVLDTEDLDVELIERIQSGDIVLDLANPFGVSADLTLEIRGPGIATLTRNLTLSDDPESTTRLSYTGTELQSFLGRPGITLEGSGVVNSGAGFLRVSPTDELVLDASLDVTLVVGG